MLLHFIKVESASGPARPKICVFGNSVPLLLIPGRKGPEEATYGELLERDGFAVVNASKQAVTVGDTCRYLENEVIRHFPDFIILNFGIVEAAYRTKPRWLQNFISGNAWNNDIVDIAHCGYESRGVRKVVRLACRPLSRAMFSVGLKWRYMSPGHFEDALGFVMNRLKAYTPVRSQVVLGMLPVNDGLERVAPGTRRSVEEFNAIMRRVAAAIGGSVFVDMNELFSSTLSDATTDSIHYTAYGHRTVFEAVKRLIEDRVTA